MNKHGRGRDKKSVVPVKKTVCRSTSRKSKFPPDNQTTVSAKRPQTLASARKQRYGVGSKSESPTSSEFDKYGRGKRKKGSSIDYSKLNEGIDQDETESPSPKRSKYTPVRSGPSQERLTAQKRVTINPSVTTLSTVKTKKSENAEEKSKKSTTLATLIGVQTPTGTAPEEDGILVSKGIHDAFLGVPDTNDLLLPDLGTTTEATYDDVLKQTCGTVSDHSQEPSQEDELDAADALLSLSSLPSMVNDDFDFGIEDNALLAPIGGNIICEDAAPTDSNLGQVDLRSDSASHCTRGT